MPGILLFLLQLEEEVEKGSKERNVFLPKSENVASFSALSLRDHHFHILNFVGNPAYMPCMKQANGHFINHFFFRKCRVNTLCASEQLD